MTKAKDFNYCCVSKQQQGYKNTYDTWHTYFTLTIELSISVWDMLYYGKLYIGICFYNLQQVAHKLLNLQTKG